MTEDHRQEEDRRALWGRFPRVLLIGLAIVGAVLIVVVALWAFVRPTDPTEKKDFLQAVGILLAGLVGLGGLYFTWRNLNQTRQTTQRTLELTERGQITERFTRAIDQLGATDDDGNKRMEIRLGGIYALERIARDSEEDHWPIMEVLTAYVRQHAPSRPEEGQQGEEDQGVEKPEKDSGDSREESEPIEVPAPAPDIQAIMTVLRRRTRYYEHGEPEPLDLHETNLSGAALWEANLQGADLRRANLSEARLGLAILSGAYLSGADLSGVDLDDQNWWEQVQEAYGGEYTRLPPYARPPAHWGVKPDEQTEGD